MKIKSRMGFLLLFILCMGVSIHSVKAVAAVKEESITVRDYIIMLMKAIDLQGKENTAASYIKEAIKAGILLEKEQKNLKKNITKTDAAVYGNRAEEWKNGDVYNAALCGQIRMKKRISDLAAIEKEKQSAVVKMFSKGIMVGTSDGSYSQSRKFRGSLLLTQSEAKIIAARVKEKRKRKVLSQDGQLIRTTNLPANYKDFEYILESFPNTFYETTFSYEVTTKGDGSKVEEFTDYVKPVHMRSILFHPTLGYKMSDVMDLYLDDWCKTVKTNLTCRFNVDYRTIDKNWIQKLRSTYYVYDFGDKGDAYENKKCTDEIKEYVAFVKKHKIIIKADQVVVEPSVVFRDSGLYIRSYIKFKIISYEGNLTQNDLFYCAAADIPGVNKGKSTEAVLDICLGTINGYSQGADYAVSGNYLFTYAKVNRYARRGL